MRIIGILILLSLAMSGGPDWPPRRTNWDAVSSDGLTTSQLNMVHLSLFLIALLFTRPAFEVYANVGRRVRGWFIRLRGNRC